jgi:hypothetical protein|tara:strand:- start:709 stop:1011 length:303 start_codon:yes stop_codon:yes gene_type:complete
MYIDKLVEFKGESLTVDIGHYTNGQIYIRLYDANGCVYMMASTAYDNAMVDPAADDVIIKNYSENHGVLDALIKADIIEKPHATFPVNQVTLYIAKLKQS